MKKRIGANGSSSGSDLPALLLRLAIGPMLIAHGYNKVFGKKRSGARWGVLAALFGIANSTLLLAASYRPEPKP